MNINERDFWKYVASLGLTPEQVYEGLGIDTLAECALSKEDLAAKIKDLAIKQAPGYSQEAHPAYARAIAWANVFTPDSIKLNLTARHGATPDDLVSVYKTWTAAWTKIKLLGARATPNSRPKAKPKTKSAASPKPKPAQSAKPPQPKPVQPKTGQATPSKPAAEGEIWLTIEHVQKNSKNDKISYRVFGPPRYRRYGVMAWPEVAEVLGQFGVDLEGMILGEKHDAAALGLQGLVLLKDGKAQKIIEIRKRPE